MKETASMLLGKFATATGTLTFLTLVFSVFHFARPDDALVNTMLTGFGSALLLALKTEAKPANPPTNTAINS